MKHNQRILLSEHPEYQEGVFGCPKALSFIPAPPLDSKPTEEMYAEWERMAAIRDLEAQAAEKQATGHPEVYGGIAPPQVPYGNGFNLPPEYYGYPPQTYDEYGQWTHGYSQQPPQDPSLHYTFDSYGNYYQPYPPEGQYQEPLPVHQALEAGQLNPEGTLPAQPTLPAPVSATQNGTQEPTQVAPEQPSDTKKLSKAEQLKQLLEKRKQKTQPN